MKDTATRIYEAMDLIHNKNIQNVTENQQQNLPPDLFILTLQREFQNTKFIYGTVGSNPINSKNLLVGGGSSTVVRAIAKLKINKRKKDTEKIYRYKNLPANDPRQRKFHQLPKFIQRKALEDLVKNTYDPGARINQLILQGCQMMDMYYGVHGNESNYLWRKRNQVIAEFIHYAMQFHTPHHTWEKAGHERWERPAQMPFDPNKPGWQAFKEAFPTAREPGWRHQPATTAVYGQSATKEMSKIIRECVRSLGGTIIFDLKGVYGHNLFGPHTTRHLGDTDLELEDILNSVNGRITTSVIPFGEGHVEFQWGGKPVVPTRAHFLVNWNWNPLASGITMNTSFNRRGEPGADFGWVDYLNAVMSDNYLHGLSPNWEKLDHFPPEFAEGTNGQENAAAIEALAGFLSGTPATRQGLLGAAV